MQSVAVMHTNSFLTRLTGVVLLAAVLGFPTATLAANQLQDVEVNTLPNEQVQIRLILSGPATKPASFSINNPARVAVDLANTTLALDERKTAINLGAVQSVTSAEAKGRTRVVVNLDSVVPYDVRAEGNSVYITLGANMLAASTAPADTSAAATPVAAVGAEVASFGDTSAQAAARAPAGRAITNVDFRRGPNGEGRVQLTLSDPKTAVDVRRQGGQVIVDFVGADIADALTQRYNVLDFATPVSSFDVKRDGKNTRLIITPVEKAQYEQLAYQSDNQFVLELKPLTPAEVEERRLAEPEYTGERLTLNFQDIETRAVLQIIADFTGLNIVVSDTVSGNVTLRLQNVPWDQALDIILKSKGLDMRRNGNVVMIAPAAEIATREKAELAAQQEIQELAPLESEFIQINYAKAADIAGIITGQSSGGGGAATPSGISLTGGSSGGSGGGAAATAGGTGGSSSGSILSERGTITVDNRTNALLIQDTAERLVQIRRLITRLDIPVRQVLIESRIVIATDDFERELGTRFGVSGYGQMNGGQQHALSGSLNGTGDILNSGGPTFNTDRLNVNLPVGQPTGRIAYSILGSDFLVDLELSALQAEGKGQVVSSPRIVTANQKEAVIEQGVEIPYLEASSSGAATISFKEALLQLIVTPQITPDDRIIMDIQVRKDSVGSEVPVQGGSFIPSIDTRAILTQVLVENGETVVLGGIYETTETNTVRKVPLLGDIPILGTLFRTTRKVNNKAELLIFVTPRIIKEGLDVAQY